MKKYLLIAVSALLLCSTGAFAQNKGDMYVGGEIGLTVNNSSSNFFMMGEYGYFFADGCRANLGLGYNHNGSSSDNLKFSSDAFVLNPEVAYYIKIIDKLYYTPELGCGLGWGSSKSRYVYENITYSRPYFEWNVYLNFGSFEFKPTNYLGFTLGVGSISVGGQKAYETGAESSYYNSNVRLNILASCSIGVKYYFK